ncbi:putative mitochondrial protein AtMg00310 [Primulina tabacum]|uniref:putative mitochondrial protein AtMg00310 n=1 Tax=Primulina tabacum TaxID=48773 RepID=UPI003F5AA115
MSVFLLPVSFAEEIQRMLNSFWWGSKKNNQRYIHWLSWDRLSIRKENGGIGFRDLYGFNLAMLGRQGWSFISSPDTLASRIFKARYFPRGDFLTAQLGHNPIFVWKSIWSSRSLLQIGCRWKIGDGTKINTWNDPWLRETNNFRVQTSMISGMESLRVAELMIPGRKQWDVDLINELLNARDTCEILKIPLQENPVTDTRI